MMTLDQRRRFSSACLRLPLAFVRNVALRSVLKDGMPTTGLDSKTAEKIESLTSKFYALLATEIKRDLKINLELGLYE